MISAMHRKHLTLELFHAAIELPKGLPAATLATGAG
jgi:hypothetical protein